MGFSENCRKAARVAELGCMAHGLSLWFALLIGNFGALVDPLEQPDLTFHAELTFRRRARI